MKKKQMDIIKSVREELACSLALWPDTKNESLHIHLAVLSKKYRIEQCIKQLDRVIENKPRKQSKGVRERAKFPTDISLKCSAETIRRIQSERNEKNA